MSATTMIQLLLEACPSAQKDWTEHLAYWGSDLRGEFIDLAVFAHFVVENYGKDSINEIRDFFELLEVFINSADSRIVGLAKYGLIEAIQNIASHRPHGYCVFEQWCLPHTLIAWSSVENEWAGKHSLAEVMRAEGSNRP